MQIVLLKALDFDVEVSKERWQLKKTWLMQVQDESKVFGLRTEFVM